MGKTTFYNQVGGLLSRVYLVSIKATEFLSKVNSLSLDKCPLSHDHHRASVPDVSSRPTRVPR
jgi:hypothetical protein